MVHDIAKGRPMSTDAILQKLLDAAPFRLIGDDGVEAARKRFRDVRVPDEMLPDVRIEDRGPASEPVRSDSFLYRPRAVLCACNCQIRRLLPVRRGTAGLLRDAWSRSYQVTPPDGSVLSAPNRQSRTADTPTALAPRRRTRRELFRRHRRRRWLSCGPA
jgi:hypothetical protein